ncbi:MAG: excinuclease ABC subunit A [Chloroflexi bacterium]|nr:excinuclease ABC subunit A [Chloroflexota bacterium]|tara:strand:+ start:47361 stop:50276 length:2916 start_codon:yes stop_codon:yes gene_type:complete
MLPENIVVQGAREHNLKDINVTIPRNKLVVVTGVSGSGKSTLAFDTIYAEGQRRYVESLSSYARQFLGRMDKPEVDYIGGLSPSISIDQKGVSHNPRSTVGTVTEIYDYLRLFFARVGHPHCYNCNRPIQKQTVQQIVDTISQLKDSSRIQILSPLVRRRKGEHKDVFEKARQDGFVRVRVNGQIHDLSEDFSLNKQQWHTIEIVVDRLIISEKTDLGRLTDSVETALRMSEGILLVSISESEDVLFSEQFACLHCNISLSELEPRTFSFNNPHGACSTCAGIGYKLEVDPDLVIPDKSKSIKEGGINHPWSKSGAMTPWFANQLSSLAEQHNFSTDIPIKQLNEEHINVILFGSKDISTNTRYKSRRGRRFRWRSTFEGVITSLQRRHQSTDSESVRREIERYMTAMDCVSCGGNKLKPEALAVTICGRNISSISNSSISEILSWIMEISSDSTSKTSGLKIQTLTPREKTIGSEIIKEIKSRLSFLKNVGLDYLSLSRRASTLSGGESQRIRLATQIGSGLMGVLYVCDEPSIGLHPADDTRLINTLKGLRDIGNTVLIVEHDEAIMRSSDFIVDLGPGAGENGGELVVAGTLDEIISCQNSITGQYLAGSKRISSPGNRRPPTEKSLLIRNPLANNLKGEDVTIPLGLLVCVTGVSGSGKSTLVNELLYKSLAQLINRSRERPGNFGGIEGIENIDKVVNIDQAPIGRTPRSNPATYTGAFTPIRELFSTVQEARARGYKPGRFSFNVKGGRCEACAGGGFITIEMQFLPDVTVPCESCGGKRYNREALEILWKGKTIADVLSMTVSEALIFFNNIPSIRNKLQTMNDVGLGYIRLGQPATQISGGEAQRVKLASELSKRSTGKTIYILDEPTTGLSFHDCDLLIAVLQRLVDSGNTVVLIEHHLDLINNADWIIDLGPGAGNNGGKIVAQGTPEQLISVAKSQTGMYLDEHVRNLKSTKSKIVVKEN